DRVAAVAPGATCVLFGHVGDGNLHVNVVGPDPGDETVDAAVLEVTARHGGTISSEHGVGVAKRPFLELTRSSEEVAAMRAIKGALAPGGLVNPGGLSGRCRGAPRPRGRPGRPGGARPPRGLRRAPQRVLVVLDDDDGREQRQQPAAPGE